MRTDSAQPTTHLRMQMFLPLIGLALACVLVMGWLGLSTSIETIRTHTIQAVGISAETRHQHLITKLSTIQQRADTTLSIIVNACRNGKAAALRQCQERVLQQFVKVNGAEAARLSLADSFLTVGPWREPDPGKFRMTGGFLAHFQKDGDAGHQFFMQSQDPGNAAQLLVRFPASQIYFIFDNRAHLGESGESFLVDGEGYFLTQPRYESHVGHSHPIHARPMVRCLSGENGQMLDPDYRGVPIIHGFRYVPEIGGGCIMAHIDQAEAFAPVTRLKSRFAVAALALILVAAALAAVLSGRVSRPIVELLGKLDQAIRTRDEFLSICSHELKTPLTALKLQAELLERKLGAAPASPKPHDNPRALVRMFQRQLDRLNQLVDDTLDVSRIMQGRLLIRPESLELNALIRDCIHRFEPKLQEAGCAVEFQGSPGVRGVWDGSRLEQVVLNLLSNAAKYGAGRPIQVTLEEVGAASERNVHITVADQGPGIAPQDQERIFERFERAVSAENVSGLGLGLYISRQIVKAHGGRMSVRSAPGQGSAFVVHLPAQSTLSSSKP